jgi:hypothetical protein
MRKDVVDLLAAAKGIQLQQGAVIVLVEPSSLLLPMGILAATDSLDPYAQLVHELIKAGTPPPPPAALFDGSQFWLVDGLPRALAYQSLGYQRMPVVVVSGTKEEAVSRSLVGMLFYGKPVTRDEKEAALRRAISGFSVEWPDEAIAKCIGCTSEAVARMRRELADA